jgi:hypothetical protein
VVCPGCCGYCSSLSETIKLVQSINKQFSKYFGHFCYAQECFLFFSNDLIVFNRIWDLFEYLMMITMNIREKSTKFVCVSEDVI